MSLVDYASSSGEEDEDKNAADVSAEATAAAPVQRPQVIIPSSPPPPEIHARHSRVGTMAPMPINDAPSSAATSAIQLPDASLLFASSQTLSAPTISGDDHASRVAAAISAGAARKREANGKLMYFPQSKQPRGNFPPRYVPGRSSALIPPQLLGRSNVSTEDVSKLFVNRRPNS